MVCCLSQIFALGESPVERTTDETQSKTVLEGTVTDILTRKPVGGVTVSVGEQSCVTDAQGHYSITGLLPGTHRMEITGDSILPRSLMFAHKDRTSLDMTVKLSDFNNAMFWASVGEQEKIKRWQQPPKWVIYSHVLDSAPPKEFAPNDRQYLFQIIRKELPAISTFFEDPQIELFMGRPNDDPRWTGKQSAAGCILCAPDDEGGGKTHWHRSWWWIDYAKIRVNYGRAPKVWRHEIGHALGMAHAFDNEKWLPLGVKDPNYYPTKLHQGEMFQDWDKLWLHCVYSGSRPAGNMPPDRDAARFVHGKDTVYIDPDAVFGLDNSRKQ